MMYTDENRGTIQNRERARQIIDFSGLRYGNITPTDVDGMMDYHNKAWIIVEMKLDGAEMPFGQQLAIERLVDDLSSVKESCGILCVHDIENPQEDIMAAETIVTQIYYKGKWEQPGTRHSLKQYCDEFIRFVDSKAV